MPKPAILLDRDGTLIEERHYLSDPSRIAIFPGAIEALSQLSRAGYALVIVTNQSGIGRGLFTEDQLAIVHRHLEELLAAGGVRLDGIYHCPHAPDQACDCRKPLPGMALDIGRRYGVELGEVPMVGDTLRDLQAAQAAGCEPHLVRSGRAASLSAAEVADMVRQVPGTVVHRDLGELATHLLERAHLRDSQSGALD